MAWHSLKRSFSYLHSRQRPPLASPSGETTVYAEPTASASSNSSNPVAASSVSLAVLIPAYQPNSALIELVEALRRQESARWAGIVVVNDGSGADYNAVFEAVSQLPSVTVLRHAINLGKGAALKTGLNYILYKHPEVAGIVTADADGQHDPADVARVAAQFQQSPGALVLGARQFDGPVPLRSAIGNRITRRAMRALLGQDLTDTQTGLRAIPRKMAADLLKLPARGYEFELESLIAARHAAIPLVEIPIRTIYEPGNPTSHFQPLRDSMRIYFVLLRFTLISISTALLDNLVFWGMLHATNNIFLAQLTARAASVVYAYPLNRRAVFMSEETHRVLLPRFLLLVAGNGAIAYLGIQSLIHLLPVGVFPAKLLIEGLLFVMNFLIQRDWVFTRKARAKVAGSFVMDLG